MLAVMMMTTGNLYSQNSALRQKAERKLEAYFYSYKPKNGVLSQPARMKKLAIDDKRNVVDITMDGNFAQQEFTKSSVEKIYRKVRRVLPNPFDDYLIRIEFFGDEIDRISEAQAMAKAK